MNPHTPKGDLNPGGLPNFQKAITGVKAQWIEDFFMSLESH
jgi:hypothetical protein